MSEGNKPLGRLRRMWEGNNNIDFGEIGWGGMVSVDLTQDMHHWRNLVNTVMKLQVL
jgi:hypothetical protein